jgi:hypothetical protein
MFSRFASLNGWIFDVAMVFLTVAAVLATHTLFKLGERLTRTRRDSHGRKA